MLRSIIYFIKRRIHRSPRLYGMLYPLATFNVDYLRQKLAGGHYQSRFGGLWTDRDDFEKLLARRPAAHHQRLRDWRRDGFAVFENAIDTALVDELVGVIERLPDEHPPGLLVTGSGYREPQPFRPDIVKPHESIRIVDLYFFNETARRILFDPGLMEFLELVFDDKPVLTQSLSFNYGSEQAVHQDTAYVIMNAPNRLLAIWIALEDVKPGSGELVYYPGSHRWRDFLFSGRFKHFDMERDGPAGQTEWLNWLHEEAARQGTRLESFLPKKGDAFVWHAGLAHGGAPIEDPGRTRLSLVGHYCPSGVRPLYHYYKPGQRRFYPYRDFQFSSAYYKRSPSAGPGGPVEHQA